MSDALILFVRKPELGKVKTRIAATEGDKAALAIYKKLLGHTRDITTSLTCTKYVFYAGAIEQDDFWSGDYHKDLQENAELGQRMQQAFEKTFRKGHHRVCIIGSDCYELTTAHIEEAFEKLSSYDVVLGPAKDGGYYLLGMKGGLKAVFENVQWSTEEVLKQTLEQICRQGYSYTLLEALNDVDTIEDVPVQWRAAPQ